MVTIDVPRRAPRVTLAALIEDRNASLAVRRLSVAAHLGRAARSARRGTAWLAHAVLAALSTLAALASRHALVLAGIAAWTAAAWHYSLIAGLLVLGAGAFFLEARRK